VGGLSDASVTIGLHQCVALTLNLFHDVYGYGVLGVLVETVLIDPSAHAEGGHQQGSDDGTAGGAHGVLAGAAGEHYANGARDGVGGQAGNGAAELGINRKAHDLVGWLLG